MATPLLSAHNVRVRYRNGALGVLDVSVDVRAEQVVALFGANGAGKTTTVRAMSGFLRGEGARVIDGTVTFAGVDVTNAEPYAIARLGLAFVPERRKIFPTLTVRENLTALGWLPPRSQRAAALDRVYELFPVVAQRGKELAGRLSGGQQQMVALARALLNNPKLLIVDEMTLGLHHSMHGPLFAAVRDIATHGTGVIVVDESTGYALQVTDYCYLVRGGRMADEGVAEKFRGTELLAAGYVGG